MEPDYVYGHSQSVLAMPKPRGGHAKRRKGKFFLVRSVFFDMPTTLLEAHVAPTAKAPMPPSTTMPITTKCDWCGLLSLSRQSKIVLKFSIVIIEFTCGL
jgi:hypothetical protein